MIRHTQGKSQQVASPHLKE